VQHVKKVENGKLKVMVSFKLPFERGMEKQSILEHFFVDRRGSLPIHGKSIRIRCFIPVFQLEI